MIDCAVLGCMGASGLGRSPYAGLLEFHAGNSPPTSPASWIRNVAYPTDLVVGELLLCFEYAYYGMSGYNLPWNTPLGWNLVRQSGSGSSTGACRVLARVVDGTEGTTFRCDNYSATQTLIVRVPDYNIAGGIYASAVSTATTSRYPISAPTVVNPGTPARLFAFFLGTVFTNPPVYGNGVEDILHATNPPPPPPPLGENAEGAMYAVAAAGKALYSTGDTGVTPITWGSLPSGGQFVGSISVVVATLT